MDKQKFNKDFYNLIEKYPNANNLVKKLSDCGEIFLFGGAVREYIDNRFNKIPRDFDIVVKKKYEEVDLDDVLEKFQYKKNRFDGYKIKVDSLKFDIWELENTWAFKENKISCLKKEYSKRLPDTVFLNIDSIVYNLSKDELYNGRYENAMNNKILDIVLEDNPYIELNMVRAILFKKKYNMNFSSKLTSLFKSFISQNKDYLDKLYEVQFKHYYDCKIEKAALEEEIKDIICFI